MLSVKFHVPAFFKLFYILKTSAARKVVIIIFPVYKLRAFLCKILSNYESAFLRYINQSKYLKL